MGTDTVAVEHLGNIFCPLVKEQVHICLALIVTLHFLASCD